MRRLSIFAAISLCGAAIDFVLISLALQLGLSSLWAFGLAMCVSGSAVYVLHQKLTFQDLSGRALSHRRLTAFLLNTLLVFAFRVAVFTMLTRAGLVESGAIALSLISSLAVNFLVSRLWIFAPRSKK